MLISSPILAADRGLVVDEAMGNADAGGSGAGGSGAGAGAGFEFGVDPSLDPELAMVSLDRGYSSDDAGIDVDHLLGPPDVHARRTSTASCGGAIPSTTIGTGPCNIGTIHNKGASTTNRLRRGCYARTSTRHVGRERQGCGYGR